MYFTRDKLQIHYSEVKKIISDALDKSPDSDKLIALKQGFIYIMNHLLENEIRLNKAEMEINLLTAQLREELKKSLLETK